MPARTIRQDFWHWSIPTSERRATHESPLEGLRIYWRLSGVGELLFWFPSHKNWSYPWNPERGHHSIPLEYTWKCWQGQMCSSPRWRFATGWRQTLWVFVGIQGNARIVGNCLPEMPTAMYCFGSVTKNYNITFLKPNKDIPRPRDLCLVVGVIMTHIALIIYWAGLARDPWFHHRNCTLLSEWSLACSLFISTDSSLDRYNM